MENKSVEVERLEARIVVLIKGLIRQNSEMCSMNFKLARLGDKESQNKIDTFLKSINIDPSQ